MLVAVALAALVAAAGVYLWPVLNAHLRSSQPDPNAPVPGTLSAMDWTSARVGWLVVSSPPPLRSTLYRTTDGGGHWRPIRSSRGLLSAAFSDSRHGVAAAHTGSLSTNPGWGPVFRTADGGAHWSRMPVPDRQLLGLPDFVDNTHGWLLAGDAPPVPNPWDSGPPPEQNVRLWYTADAGQHWRLLLQTDRDHRLSQGISEDGAKEWISFDDLEHGWLASTVAGGKAELFRSQDGGISWEAVPLPPPGEGWPPGVALPTSVEVSANGAGALVVSDYPSPAAGTPPPPRTWVWSTRDGGRTWLDPVELPVAVLAVQPTFPDGGSGWWAAGSRVWTSRDWGQTWQQAGDLPHGWSFNRLVAEDGSVAWAEAIRTPYVSGRLYATVDGGRHWRQVSLPATVLPVGT